jgi:hypothetical protein
MSYGNTSDIPLWLSFNRVEWKQFYVVLTKLDIVLSTILRDIFTDHLKTIVSQSYPYSASVTWDLRAVLTRSNWRPRTVLAPVVTRTDIWPVQTFGHMNTGDVRVRYGLYRNCIARARGCTRKHRKVHARTMHMPLSTTYGHRKPVRSFVRCPYVDCQRTYSNVRTCFKGYIYRTSA